MRKLILAAGAATFCLCASATASFAGMVAQPGETMGLAVGAPLPEGVFGLDLEDYGHRDNSNGRLGVNIPLLVWATPFTLLDSRVQVLYAAPFIHQDGLAGPGETSRLDFYSQLLAVQLAHDFGNGFGASIIAGVRTPDSQFNPDYTSADIRPAISYTANGYDLTATFYYNGAFGGSLRRSDAVNVDFTATKKFGKLEAGFVGYASTDINTRIDNVAAGRVGRVAVGGLVGYDFGPFTLQGMVTREVAARGLAGNNGSTTNKETRGWLRVIVPLYVAPKATPVVARY